MLNIDVESAGQDPGERFAVTAATYVRYVADRGAGFNVIFAAPLTHLEPTELSDAGRELISLLLGLAECAGDAPGTEQAMVLLERHIVTARGYVTLHQDGFFASRRDAPIVTIAERGTQASRALLRGEGPALRRKARSIVCERPSR